jgi:hypothetical protein
MRQHDQMETLLRSLAVSRSQVSREMDLQELGRVVRQHFRLEEEFLLPAAANRASPSLVETSHREHGRVRGLLEALESRVVELPFEERRRRLEDAVVGYLGEEEGDLFPELKQLFEVEELETMGARMEEALGAVGIEPTDPVEAH